MALIANERIRHNGKVFEKGEAVEGLNKKDEGRLLKLGSASKLPAFNIAKEKEKDGE